MEFHDVLHGHLGFPASDLLTDLLRELIDSPEINRLRNMRQMNFDVPLIQELGRSRRLPHSIGVTYIAATLARKARLDTRQTRVLLAAAMLHDAAIPPYGHLVETEFKNAGIDFKHERRVAELINGTINRHNKYMPIVPGRPLKIAEILERFDVDPQAVIELICPEPGASPISADVDLDNIDNVHRMAAMLGWSGVRENCNALTQFARLDGLAKMIFSREALPALERWLDYRQRIYTLIIAHPQCIPHNALQTDMVRIAVANKIISPQDWFLSEPLFEQALRDDERTKTLAEQLISGCSYQLIDYVWFKQFPTRYRLNNAFISNHLAACIDIPSNYGYFVWNERGLISRRVKVSDGDLRTVELGADSTSCMIALVKRTPGKPRWPRLAIQKWRREAADQFSRLFATQEFRVDFPETYTGDFLRNRSRELGLEY